MSEPEAYSVPLPARLGPSRIREVATVEGRRAAKYGIVGVTSVSIDFGLYALMVIGGVWYPVAKVISLAVGTANAYTWNRIWTFRAGRHRHAMLARYLAVQGCCLALNIALLALFVETLGHDKIGAQLVAIPIVASVSFLGQRLWTFARSIS